MKLTKQRLVIEQVDTKINVLRPAENLMVPGNGWINAVRKALKMSLRQLAERMRISPQSLNEAEQREVMGTITLKSLRETANALNMKLVYGFIPKEGSLETMIEKRAMEIASEIVLRTSNTMRLEDQENSKDQVSRLIKSKAEEIMEKMPRYLWD